MNLRDPTGEVVCGGLCLAAAAGATALIAWWRHDDVVEGAGIMSQVVAANAVMAGDLVEEATGQPELAGVAEAGISALGMAVTGGASLAAAAPEIPAAVAALPETASEHVSLLGTAARRPELLTRGIAADPRGFSRVTTDATFATAGVVAGAHGLGRATKGLVQLTSTQRTQAITNGVSTTLSVMSWMGSPAGCTTKDIQLGWLLKRLVACGTG